MEHLIQKSKCSIFYDIFKYKIFQRLQKRYYGVKGKVLRKAVALWYSARLEIERWLVQASSRGTVLGSLRGFIIC